MAQLLCRSGWRGLDDVCRCAGRFRYALHAARSRRPAIAGSCRRCRRCRLEAWGTANRCLIGRASAVRAAEQSTARANCSLGPLCVKRTLRVLVRSITFVIVMLALAACADQPAAGAPAPPPTAQATARPADPTLVPHATTPPTQQPTAGPTAMPMVI